MTKPKRKRHRGVILTDKGLEKLQEARLTLEHQENFGERYTYETISGLTSLDINTIKRVLHGNHRVDKRSLEKFFQAFKLKLRAEFYTKPNLNQRLDWGEAVAVDNFFGRTNEFGILSNWLLQERCRLIALLGMGGIGKTSLSIKLAQQVSSEFDCVIWKSLRDAPPVGEIVTYLIEFLSQGRETEITLPPRLGDKISRLIGYLRSQRCLILFDNIESLMDAHHRAGKYRQGYEGYGELIRRIGATEHNSCLILTTREKPTEVVVLEGDKLRVRSLQLAGLTEGREIIRAKGLSASESQLAILCDRYNGNPLALKVVSAMIKDLFAGNITQFLRQEKAVFGDIRDLLDQQFARLSDLEQELMYWIAIAREPVSLAQLQSDLVRPRSSIKLLEALESLSRRSLIEKSEMGLTQQSVVMEYLSSRLVESVCQEIIDCQPKLLRSYALIKATAKDYIRENQIRLILQPVIKELLNVLRSKQNIEKYLHQILLKFQETSPPEQSYGAGNIINLFCHLKTDLTGYNFSDLSIWQADLRQAKLHRVNFQNADLSKSVFAENFGGIWSVAFSPDGQYLAAGDTKGDIVLRRVSDGQPIRIFEGHSAWVVSLAFSPDGNILASSSCDCTAKLWNVNTNQCIHSLEEHEHEVWSVAFSPDGTTLATGCDDHKARLWNVATGKCIKILTGHKDCILSVKFGLDGQKLFTGSHDNTIKKWHLKTGKCLQVFQEHEDGVRSISLSPNGQMLASSSNDQTIRLWDTQTGTCLKVLQGHENVVMSVTFSPQGNLLASSSLGHKIRLWNINTGECLRVIQGHANIVNSIAFNPLANVLASGSYDQTVKLWNVDTYQCLKTWQGNSNQVLSVTFSADSQRIFSGGQEQKVRIWDAKSGQVLQTLHAHHNWVFSVKLNSRQNILASGSGDKTIKLWNIETGKVIKTLTGHKAVVRSLAFGLDGRILASGSEDLTARLWDVATGKCLHVLKGHKAEVWSVCSSADGKILASASFDSMIKLWDVTTGKCLKTLEGHKSWVWSTAFSPDGKTLISTSADQTIRLWNIDTGEATRILRDNLGHSPLIAFSPDGLIVASCSPDHRILLWQVEIEKCYQILHGHTALISSIAFSPDGHTLVSSSEDETIRIWDLSSGECIKVLIVDKPYKLMNIEDISGLSPVNLRTLQALGAISR